MNSNTSQASGLHTKISEIAKEVGYVAKDQRNENQKYNYVSDAAFVNAVRDHMISRNVTIVPRVNADSVLVQQRNGKSDFVTTFCVEYVFTDGDTGESITATTIGQGYDSLDKGGYKAMTGALKYVLRQTFLIATGDDAEAPTVADADDPTEKQRETVRNLVKTLKLEGDDKDMLFAKHGIQHGVPASRDQIDGLIAELIEMAQPK